MDVSAKKKPKVRISYDDMEAYLLLPTPVGEDNYELSEVIYGSEASVAPYDACIFKFKKS